MPRVDPRPPTAEEWVEVHKQLTDVGHRHRHLPKRQRRGYLAEQAREMCGFRLERLRRGGPFRKRMAHEAYAAEFLATLLGELPDGEATDAAIEARMRARFLGFHPEVTALRRKVARCLLARGVPILLIGDRGTGKGLLARAAAKAIGKDELLTVPLSGVSEGLAESELFGHRKGSFTGATDDHKGILRAASDSRAMVFLDDVGECAEALQVKLLTALEEGLIRPVGSDSQIPIGSGLERHFRLFASCHPSSLGNLRSDLRDRLSGLPAWVPPLRDRGADILMLADRTALDIASRLEVAPPTFSNEGRVAMLQFEWPGNVRQLISVIQRAVILAAGRDIVITPGRLASLLEEESRLSTHEVDTEASSHAPPEMPEDWPSLAEFTDRYIAKVLAATGGNIGTAAQILKIHRSTVRRRMRKDQKRRDDGGTPREPGTRRR